MGTVGLTSITLLVLLVLALLGAMAAAVLLSPRVRGPRPVRIAQRLGMVVAAQLAALLVIGLVINDSMGFFVSWADLLGGHTGAAITGGGFDAASARGAAQAVENAFGTVAESGTNGVLLSSRVEGRVSKVSARMLLWLPPQYTQPAWASYRFPVVELYPGYPGSPESWVKGLHIEQVMAQAILSGLARPFVAVIPTTTVTPPRDTNCEDVVGGPKVDTFLSTDVPRAVMSGFRVRRDRAGWAGMGLSEGGYCAAILAMRHPDRYSAAVSLSGAFWFPPKGRHDIFGGSARLRSLASPVWRAKHLRPPAVSLLLTATRSERTEYAELRALAAAARPPLRVATMVLPKGGHNPWVWGAELPAAIQWLAAHFDGVTFVAKPPKHLPRQAFLPFCATHHCMPATSKASPRPAPTASR